VGLELIDKGIARHGHKVMDEEKNEIGFVTSGTMSPTLKKAIALAYVSKKFTPLGSVVHVQVRTRLLKAKVVHVPFGEKPKKKKKKPKSPEELRKKLVLSNVHRHLGGVMVDFAGFDMPV